MPVPVKIRTRVSASPPALQSWQPIRRARLPTGRSCIRPVHGDERNAIALFGDNERHLVSPLPCGKCLIRRALNGRQADIQFIETEIDNLICQYTVARIGIFGYRAGGAQLPLHDNRLP